MVVYAFDFDLESGNISNKRLLIDRRDSFGEPDGMVVEYVLPLYYFAFLYYTKFLVVPKETSG